MKYNILHIDDHEIFRSSLAMLIELENDYHVKCQLASTKDTLESLENNNIQILILDISIDSTDTYALIKRVRSSYANLHIVALSMHEDLYIIRKMLRAGVDAYVSKTSPYDQLINALQSIGKTEKYICNRTASILASSIMQSEPILHDKLTYREFHIFTMISQGVAIKDIAKTLNLSPKTISSHKSRLMSKMNFSNNLDIIKYYQENINHH